MSEAPGSTNDPSMDDILASIRKIISDDEARAQGSEQVTPSHAATSDARSKATPTKRDDVLLLTDLVEDPEADSKPALLPLPRTRRMRSFCSISARFSPVSSLTRSPAA